MEWIELTDGFPNDGSCVFVKTRVRKEAFLCIFSNNSFGKWIDDMEVVSWQYVYPTLKQRLELQKRSPRPTSQAAHHINADSLALRRNLV